MTLDVPGKIVTDPRPLSEEHLPEELVSRAKHQRNLLDYLQAGLDKGKPLHAWLSGRPGAGKSSVVRKILGDLEQQGTRTAYVNCGSVQTFHGLLEALLQELRALIGEKREVAFKFERLSRLVRERPLVIALDEVDMMFLKERNAALYNLASLENAGIIGLSISRGAYLSLDLRIKSRLNPKFLKFESYGHSKLVQILKNRATKSLRLDSWCEADFESIATQAEGDARIAIQGLRVAAYLAEKKNRSYIAVEDIEEGLRKASRLKKEYLLKTLSEHHRLLYRIVSESGQIESSFLWKQYRFRARTLGIQPMARRTFNHYKQFLVRNRLLEEKQGKGRRNSRILRVVE